MSWFFSVSVASSKDLARGTRTSEDYMLRFGFGNHNTLDMRHGIQKVIKLTSNPGTPISDMVRI